MAGDSPARPLRTRVRHGLCPVCSRVLSRPRGRPGSSPTPQGSVTSQGPSVPNPRTPVGGSCLGHRCRRGAGAWPAAHLVLPTVASVASRQPLPNVGATPPPASVGLGLLGLHSDTEHSAPLQSEALTSGRVRTDFSLRTGHSRPDAASRTAWPRPGPCRPGPHPSCGGLPQGTAPPHAAPRCPPDTPPQGPADPGDRPCLSLTVPRRWLMVHLHVLHFLWDPGPSPPGTPAPPASWAGVSLLPSQSCRLALGGPRAAEAGRPVSIRVRVQAEAPGEQAGPCV